MQNVFQVRETLHTQNKNMQCKKFFYEYFGVLFIHFYIFISISGGEMAKTSF